MLDLTVFVLTQNNERTLRACLDSVAWCERIMVVDSFSTDNTEQIARSYPQVTFLQHEYENYMEQRIWGIPQVKTKWTFTVDSDEICTPELRDKVVEIVQSGDETYDGYLFLIRTRILGRLLKHKDLLSSMGKRLVLTRHAARYWRKARVHAQLRLDNKKVMPFKYYLIHDPIGNFGDHFKKMARYARWQAQDLFDKGVKPHWWHYTLRPVGKFLQFYVLKGGFRDGLPGLIVCALGAMNVALKHIILAELQHEAKQS